VALVGENGAGKTTLMRCVMNFTRDYEGEVLIGGERYTGREKGVAGAIGYVSESVDLMEDLTVSDHVALAQALSPAWDPAAADRLIRSLDLARHKQAKHLSRGNRVKLGLVLALSRRPAVLVLDEPTSGLDPLVREVVVGEICNLRGSAATLISSHILDDVRQLADTIAIIRGGRLVDLRPNTASLDELRTDVVRMLKEGREPR
jgi:ABC-2 type transport system ATP-binding protein